jgi:hypothetical protein
MATLVGTTMVDRFTVIDSEGNLVTGETFTADQALAPDGSTFAPSITEIGSGMYQVSQVLTQAGTYYLRLVTDTLAPFQVYDFQWETDDYLAGDTVTTYFTLRDDDGNYYGGSTVTVQVAADPAGQAFVPIITDLMNGLYRVVWTTIAAGVYTLRLSAELSNVGDDPQIFEFEARVYEIPVVIPVLESSTGTTLDELVRAVARACKDYLNLLASEDAPDAGTWKDSLQLAGRSPKMFKGASLFVWSAADPDNIGIETRVLDSVGGGLTLEPPLASPPRRGDRAYLTNLESQGFTRDTYVETINDHIDFMFPDYLIPAYWAFTDAFNGTSPFITPPMEFTHITSVGYNAAYDSGRVEYIPAANEYMDGWGWDAQEERLVIYGRWRTAANGAYMQIRGFGRCPRLEADDDQTPIDMEFLVQSTSADLIMSLRDARRQAEGAWHANRADALRVKAIRMLPSGTVRIR